MKKTKYLLDDDKGVITVITYRPIDIDAGQFGENSDRVEPAWVVYKKEADPINFNKIREFLFGRSKDAQKFALLNIKSNDKHLRSIARYILNKEQDEIEAYYINKYGEQGDRIVCGGTT